MFEKNPLQNGVSRNINEYSQDLENRVGSEFTSVETKVTNNTLSITNNTNDITTIKGDILVQSSPLTLASGWSGNSSFSEPRVSKMIDLIVIQGFVTGGVANSTITTLPAIYRPTRAMRFKTASAGTETLIQVNTNGTIVVQGTNTTNIFLDGISYIK